MIHLPEIPQPSQPDQVRSQLDQLSIGSSSVGSRSFEGFDLEPFPWVEGKVSGLVTGRMKREGRLSDGKGGREGGKNGKQERTNEIINVDGVGC